MTDNKTCSVDIYEYAYELLVPETAAGQWLHCSER